MFGCFFELYGGHRDLHVLTHSFPTRRSSDLARSGGFVSRVYARAPGDVVRAGAPIADLLLPEWGGAQTEYLSVRRLGKPDLRSEEHTSELQSLMRISYAVFCLKTKNNTKQ